jgi:hypothetical protein
MVYTIKQVSERIHQVIDGSNPRDLKPAQRRQRAQQLADLYEIRAQLFAEIDLATAVIPAALDDLAMATARAADNDRDSMKFWRGEAGRR